LGAVEQRHSAMQSSSGKFVNDNYNRLNTLRERFKGGA
jgi:hypothetical protein